MQCFNSEVVFLDKTLKCTLRTEKAPCTRLCSVAAEDGLTARKARASCGRRSVTSRCSPVGGERLSFYLVWLLKCNNSSYRDTAIKSRR